MARKTNKTAHVLNLISKAKDEHQAMEEQMQIDNTGSDVSNDLLFMGIEPTNDKSISEKINDNLETFVENGEELSEQEPEITEQNENMIEEETQHSLNSEIHIEETNMNTQSEETMPLTDPTEPTKETETTKMNTTSTIPSDEIPDENPAKPVEEKVFYYINVYESLVVERLEEFQRMFDVCTCPRCSADIIALALTNLPARYIVSDNKKTIPLLSFYREKFKTSIAAQLSNACIVVKQKPNH